MLNKKVNPVRERQTHTSGTNKIFKRVFYLIAFHLKETLITVLWVFHTNLMEI